MYISGISAPTDKTISAGEMKERSNEELRNIDSGRSREAL